MSGTKKCPGGCGRNISANKKSCDACKERPKGELSILNVGAGDIVIKFSTASVSEVIRAKRIVSDMLRRGYALVVEVERNGEKAWERIKEFDEKRGEYIVADFDPLTAHDHDMEEAANKLNQERDLSDGQDLSRGYPDAIEPSNEEEKPEARKRGRPATKRLPMTETKATAVGRSAGG